MENNKKTNLSAKVAAIMTATLASTLLNNSTTPTTQVDDNIGNRFEITNLSKRKPMPVLKLNVNNPSQSVFVAMHRSPLGSSSYSP